MTGSARQHPDEDARADDGISARAGGGNYRDGPGGEPGDENRDILNRISHWYVGRVDNTDVNTVKWAAVAIMCLDNTNRILLGGAGAEVAALGQLAAPLFALIVGYHLGNGHTTAASYLKKIAPFAIASIPISYVAFSNSLITILMTLGFGVGLYALHEKPMRTIIDGIARWLATIIIMALGIVCEGGLPVLIMIPAAAMLFRDKNPAPMLLFALTAIYGDFEGRVGLISLLALPLFISLRKSPIKAPQGNKWGFYAFYPAHLLAILAAGWVIGLGPIAHLKFG